MYCRNCGAQINDNAKFCESCGASQTQEQAATPAQIQSTPQIPAPYIKQTKQKKRKNGCLVVFIILFAVFLVAAIIGSTINKEAGNTTTDQTELTSSKAETTTQKDVHTLEFLGGVLENKGFTFWNGEPYIIMQFRFTNTGTKAASLIDRCKVKVFQNGGECSRVILPPLNLNYDVELNQDVTEVKPGVTIDVNIVYKLQNESGPFEVEVQSPNLEIVYGGWSHRGN